MTVSRHVEEAADKLQEAGRRIAPAREGPDTSEKQRIWLEALTAYSEALADIQTYNNEFATKNCTHWRGGWGCEKFRPRPDRRRRCHRQHRSGC